MRPPAPHAEPEPIDRREGQFRPVVEEAVLAIVRKIEAHPHRDGIEPFVVVARFEVQPVPVGGDSWLHIVAVVRHSAQV